MCPKPCFGHTTKFQLEILTINMISGMYIFARSFWRVLEALLKQPPGGRLNKKDGLTRYGDSHVKDKTS